MRKITNLLPLWIALVLGLNGCGPSTAPAATPVTSSVMPATRTQLPEAALPTGEPITEMPTGKTILVTNPADSGSGTLRQSLLDAQSGDIITFDPEVFPPDNPATIFLSMEKEYSADSNVDPSALLLPPGHPGGITIDASNVGVILDGINISSDFVNGLQIYSDGNIIQGLQIVNFTGAGIRLCGTNNTIGGDRSIGVGPMGQGNLISKNWHGIDLCPLGSNNTVAGNIIGGDLADTEDWGNKMDGIWIEDGATQNAIGPYNIIAHNAHVGIRITGSTSFGNMITRNRFHDNAFGIRLWDNANRMLNAPLIFDFDLALGTVTGTACANCTIEIFSTQSLEGEIFEGQTETNSAGVFTFDHGIPFTGPSLTATATDSDGNTSEFPLSNSSARLQEGNAGPIFRLQLKQSNELDDNNIGIHFSNLWHLQPEVFPDGILNANHILSLGVTRARFAINDLDTPWGDGESRVDWSKPEMSIDPSHDEFITTLAENGITITYVLNFYDKEYVAQGGNLDYPRYRFRTGEEMDRYLEFVRFVVNHFKDRVTYFEIWNEYRLAEDDLEDYINLVENAIPVIRQEYPEAKIVVGSIPDSGYLRIYDHLLGILKTDDLMPLVDAISWHGMYDTSPDHPPQRQYYYDYPSIVREIRETATAHGFHGEYVSDEMVWGTAGAPTHTGTYHSEIVAAKYYARGIIMNLGMDVRISLFYGVPDEHPLTIVRTIQNLTNIMSGNRPAELPLEVQSEVANVASYGFTSLNGDNLLAIWNDGIAVDFDPGISSTVIIPGFAGWEAIGADTVYGYEQELVTSSENGDLVIHDFLLKDYPVVIRLSK